MVVGYEWLLVYSYWLRYRSLVHSYWYVVIDGKGGCGEAIGVDITGNYWYRIMVVVTMVVI